MSALNDLTGRRFDRLAVTARVAGPSNRRSYWDCVCDCGNTVHAALGSNLAKGHTRSCGCIKLEMLKARSTTHGHATRRRLTREYQAWRSARNRCNWPKSRMWHAYGGRGIRMCDEWQNDFTEFFAHLGPCPDGYELERKDTNGHYEPGNVTWIPGRLQNRNQRHNRLLTFRGKTQCAASWAEELGLDPKTLRARILRGWSAERAILEPLRVWPSQRSSQGKR